MTAKAVCAWGFYYAGDLLSRIMPRYHFARGWDLYQWLMQRSTELDPDYKVWGRAEEWEDVPPEPED